MAGQDYGNYDSLNFMVKTLATTCYAAGVVVTNLALLKAVNSISGIALAAVSYIQGLGVASNETKEGVKKEDQIGEKLSARAKKTVGNDLVDLPKTAVVTTIGLGLMYVSSQLGGINVAGLACKFIPGAKDC